MLAEEIKQGLTQAFADDVVAEQRVIWDGENDGDEDKAPIWYRWLTYQPDPNRERLHDNMRYLPDLAHSITTIFKSPIKSEAINDVLLDYKEIASNKLMAKTARYEGRHRYNNLFLNVIENDGSVKLIHFNIECYGDSFDVLAATIYHFDNISDDEVLKQYSGNRLMFVEYGIAQKNRPKISVKHLIRKHDSLAEDIVSLQVNLLKKPKTQESNTPKELIAGYTVEKYIEPPKVVIPPAMNTHYMPTADDLDIDQAKQALIKAEKIYEAKKIAVNKMGRTKLINNDYISHACRNEREIANAKKHRVSLLESRSIFKSFTVSERALLESIQEVDKQLEIYNTYATTLNAQYKEDLSKAQAGAERKIINERRFWALSAAVFTLTLVGCLAFNPNHLLYLLFLAPITISASLNIITESFKAHYTKQAEDAVTVPINTYQDSLDKAVNHMADASARVTYEAGHPATGSESTSLIAYNADNTNANKNVINTNNVYTPEVNYGNSF